MLRTREESELGGEKVARVGRCLLFIHKTYMLVDFSAFEEGEVPMLMLACDSLLP